MITVTLYGRAHDLADVYADGSASVVTSIRDTDTTAEVNLPDNTRLLAVWARDYSDDQQPGILIKLSNGFITGSHWKCTHPYHVDWHTLTYDDSAWSQAETYSWPWGEHDLHPAQFISGSIYSRVYCRGWVSKYIKHDD